MKIIVYLVTALVQLAGAVAGFFVLLIGLNGYSERQATPSLIFYLALSVICTFSMGALANLAAKFFQKKNWLGAPGAACVGILGMSIVGGAILLAGLFVAFALAEVARGMR